MSPTEGPGADRHDQDARVDELRQRLRTLGYLDAGVDRFVLGPAREARGPVAIAGLAAVRVGVLAAVLLGPAAALGIATRLPGLVTGPRDAVVIALYLALLFGVAAAAISFIASLVVAWLPIRALRRHARRVSRMAGTIVGALCLVYLTLWWRIANPDLAALSPVWSASALAIAVAISLLLGHAAAISAFAVLVSSHGTHEPAERTRRSHWRLTATAALAAFSGAAALLLIAAPRRPAESAAPALAVVSPGLRVSVIAIDGFDPAVAEAIANEGHAPTLARLMSGATARLDADPVRDPARTWTTIATGQPPEVHGVYGLETRRLAGVQGTVTSVEPRGVSSALRGATDLLRLTRPSTASGTEVRSKAFWEVASDAGLRAAVVNWWATWPAAAETETAPVVISDRATIRLEHGGSLDGEIAPKSAYDKLRTDWPAIKREVNDLVSARLTVPTESVPAAMLRRAGEVDAVQIAIARRLKLESLDLSSIYLPGLDIAQHSLLGASSTATASVLAARLEDLRSYYVYLDGLLRDLVVPANDQLVVVVTLPGRIESRTHGLVLLAGAVAAAGDLTGHAVDVAPTVLHAVGVPISRELPGRPLLGLFTAEFTRRFPVREVETYGHRVAPAGLVRGQPLDQEMIERLRSLGYVR